MCTIKSKSHLILFIIMYIFKIIILLSIAILTFIEYNNRIIHNEMRIILIILYFNVISIFLLIVIYSIKIDKFYIQFFIKSGIFNTIIIINYLYIIWVRMHYEKSKQVTIMEQK